MYKKISDYGLIGDMHAVALVSRDGSIDYCSLPHMDSPTVFVALLDDEKGGFFSIQPAEDFQSSQSYIKNTNILKCFFKTSTGSAELIDFMPISITELFEKKEHGIHRELTVTKGTMNFKLVFFPRPQYAQGTPRIKREKNKFTVTLNNEIFTLIMSVPGYTIPGDIQSAFTAFFSLNEKQTAHIDFFYGDTMPYDKEHSTFHQTRQFWLEWLENSVSDKTTHREEFSDMINRSLLVLKLLTFKPTGAIAAAATTSLPESIGAERNWDYRFTWLRDASFTLKAMFALGHISEADSFVRWLHNTYRKHGSHNLQIMYSLNGESNLTETTLDHLKGYKNSKPVRNGNGAFNQKQWDIYGEVMDTALRLSDYAGKIDETLWPFFRDVCARAVQNWRQPDDGIWEVRNGPFHFIYSKAMCWVALDRGITIAERYGFDAPIDVWKKEKELIKEYIVQNGYNKKLNSFVQHSGSEELDASLLLLGLMHFLPFHDERIIGTMTACRNKLMRNGFLLRYSASDGLGGEEGSFILCNFWLIESLARSGNIVEAKQLLRTTMKSANHLGLFSEEFDSNNNEALGNFPQAFSHTGFINATTAIMHIEHKNGAEKKHIPFIDRMKKLIPYKVFLNKKHTKTGHAPRDIAARLKTSLHTLQGGFFDVEESRVNYTAIKKSRSFKQYLSLADELDGFDISILRTDNEKKAFWINIYNILTIHGVIHFNIKNSAREVFQFFSRICYHIGGFSFSPDDIEHGILRSNRPHPSLSVKQFSPADARDAHTIQVFDPRIHFALVCAASSCPPIEFYDPEKIEHQLDIAGKSFINRRGLTIDNNKNTVYLSQIFKWYASDFGRNTQEILEKILIYTDKETKEYIKENRRKITIRYLPYDWNLNKTLKNMKGR